MIIQREFDFIDDIDIQRRKEIIQGFFGFELSCHICGSKPLEPTYGKKFCSACGNLP